MLVFKTVEFCMLGFITGQKYDVKSHNWQDVRIVIAGGNGMLELITGEICILKDKPKSD